MTIQKGRGLRGLQGRAGPRGPAGPTGQRGIPGVAGRPAPQEVMSRLVKDLEAVQRDLKIQFERIAQIQTALDAVVRNLASN